MNSKMDTNHVSDIIDWNKHIANHKINALISGTGSGKNTFIKKLANNDIDGAENKAVLVITPRLAVVSETISDRDFFDVFETYLSIYGNVKVENTLEFLQCVINGTADYSNDENFKNMLAKYNRGDIFNKSVICTPAKVEAFLWRNCFKHPELFRGENNIIWKLFDVIVLDEAHAIKLDSTYQSACYYIFKLIICFYKYCNDNEKKLILMSGTYKPIEKLLDFFCDGTIHKINLMNKCVNIKPEKVEFVYKENVKASIEQNYLNGDKVIYFYNREIQYPLSFCEGTSINPDDVLSFFSKQEAKSYFKKIHPDGFKMLDKARNTLAKEQRLPDEAKITLSTSCLREGQNIKNDDIAYVYIDSHNPAHIIQYCGRLRNSKFTVRIVVNSSQFEGAMRKKLGQVASEKELVGKINEEYQKLENPEEREEFVRAQIDEDTHSYGEFIMYNCFEDRFEFNSLKEEALRYELEVALKWDYLDKNKANSYSEYIREYLDGTNISKFTTREYLSWKTFNDHKFKMEDTFYSQKKIDSFIKELQGIWDSNVTSINVYFKKFAPHIKCVRCGDNKKKFKFVYADEK